LGVRSGPRGAFTRGLPYLASAGLALGLAGVCQAAPQPPKPIYDCARGDPADKAICRTPNLKRSLHVIDAHYAVATTFGDPDVRFLAGWDRYYFAVGLWSCNALSPIGETTVAGCVRDHVSRKEEAMAGGVTREGLLQGLIRAGSLNVTIVERYPNTLVDRVVSVCARTRLRRTITGALVGRATDCRSGGVYSVRVDHPSHNDRTLLAGPTEALAWMTGRFELHHDGLEFKCRPGSATPAGPGDAPAPGH
jgi:hypothetical protein